MITSNLAQVEKVALFFLIYMCSMDLNHTSFESNLSSLTGRLHIITGYIYFYSDYKFKEERKKGISDGVRNG